MLKTPFILHFPTRRQGPCRGRQGPRPAGCGSQKPEAIGPLCQASQGIARVTEGSGNRELGEQIGSCHADPGGGSVCLDFVSPDIRTTEQQVRGRLTPGTSTGVDDGHRELLSARWDRHRGGVGFLDPPKLIGL